MENWKNIKIEHISSIGKIVAYFEVWSVAKFPSSKIKIKITENQHNSFTSMPNMAAKEKQSLSPDWRAGFGRNVEEALEDTIKTLLESIAQNEAVEDDDFEWADPHDF